MRQRENRAALCTWCLGTRGRCPAAAACRLLGTVALLCQVGRGHLHCEHEPGCLSPCATPARADELDELNSKHVIAVHRGVAGERKQAGQDRRKGMTGLEEEAGGERTRGDTGKRPERLRRPGSQQELHSVQPCLEHPVAPRPVLACGPEQPKQGIGSRG